MACLAAKIIFFVQLLKKITDFGEKPYFVGLAAREYFSDVQHAFRDLHRLPSDTCLGDLATFGIDMQMN